MSVRSAQAFAQDSPTPTGVPRVVAHRGASAIAPENTLLAFRLAIEAGAEMIETDAHLARDGEIVLIHDSDLRRTTNCNGMVASLPAGELASCDAGYWFSPAGDRRHPFRGLGLNVPRLVDAIELVRAIEPSVQINIEIKNLPGEIDFDPENRLARKLVRLLRDTGATDWVLVSSFNADAIDCVKALDESIRTAYLCGPRADLHARTAYAYAKGHDAVHPHHSTLGHNAGLRQIVDVVHRAGMEINAWTVNDPQRMLELAEAGVDGIITDDPGLLRQVLKRASVAT